MKRGSSPERMGALIALERLSSVLVGLRQRFTRATGVRNSGRWRSPRGESAPVAGPERGDLILSCFKLEGTKDAATA